MYSTLVSVALFSALAIQGALADFTVVTPEITQCEPVHLSWDNTGAKSYNVIIVPNDDPCNEVLALTDAGDRSADLGDHTVNHITWTPNNLKEGAVVMVSVLDSNDQEGWSGAITVKKGNDTSCLPGASSSAAASSTSSVAALASAGTTLVINPAAAPTSFSSAPAAPSSSGAATAVGAANAGIVGGSNGALSSVKVSASALLLTLGAVAAIAF
ncbi:hypothetical protein OH77DRAFT_1434240 [Trametes cingulata]|nr:hypothetical protein OH77DRAFT_1434240 [Trametes cingulata]